MVIRECELSDSNKFKDAEDVLSEFNEHKNTSTESPPESAEQPTPEPATQEPPEPTPEQQPSEPSAQEPSQSEPEQPTPEPPTDDSKPIEDRDVIFVGIKPIMTYVSATLTQLSTRDTVTIKARGKRITQAVDVSQMIVKRMDTVGYFVNDVRISSDSLTSQDGKQRNVSTIEIDITKK